MDFKDSYTTTEKIASIIVPITDAKSTEEEIAVKENYERIKAEEVAKTIISNDTYAKCHAIQLLTDTIERLRSKL